MKSPKHTTMSASSAHRWLKCTKSTELVKYVPAQPASPYASEGTEAHKEFEQILLTISSAQKASGINWEYFTPEQVNVLLKFLCDLGANDIQTESTLSFLNVNGTLDAYFLCPEREAAFVIDLKYGEGFMVEPVDNPQLALYALAIKNTYPGVKKVCTYIYQPRGDFIDTPFSEWILDREALEAWVYIFQTALAKILNNDLEYSEGSHCSWCPALAVCPKKKEALKAITKYDTERKLQPVLPDPKSLTFKELENIELHYQAITSWLKKCHEFNYNIAMSGYKFKHLKLVEGRSSRKWNGEESEVAKELESLGIEEPYKKKLKGLTLIEKEIGKGKIDHLTTKPPGSLKLVPRDDNRVEVGTNDADVDFNDTP